MQSGLSDSQRLDAAFVSPGRSSCTVRSWGLFVNIQRCQSRNVAESSADRCPQALRRRFVQTRGLARHEMVARHVEAINADSEAGGIYLLNLVQLDK